MTAGSPATMLVSIDDVQYLTDKARRDGRNELRGQIAGQIHAYADAGDLPPEVSEQLHELAEKIKHNELPYTAWGRKDTHA
jgi:hypothetical protein